MRNFKEENETISLDERNTYIEVKRQKNRRKK
jgi:hypothetical protein